MDQTTALAAVEDVIHACRNRLQSPNDQLAVLEVAWLLQAKQARAAVSTDPPRFSAEQIQQVAHLTKMATLVRADTGVLAQSQIHQSIQSVWKDLQGLREPASTQSEE